MYFGYDASTDIATITDAEVASDWRKGMLRSLGKLVVESGVAEGLSNQAWGVVTFKEGSLAEHFFKGHSVSKYGILRGTQDCTIVSIKDMKEYSHREYEFSTFGSDEGHDVLTVSATVTCEHGVSGKMSVDFSLGEFISAVASTM